MIGRPVPTAFLLPALALCLIRTPVPAQAANPADFGWVFDRLTWSPGGDSLAVTALPCRARAGVYEAAAEPMVLIVDASTGGLSMPPEARSFQVSGGGDALLLLGSWGLWHLDPATGRTRQLHVSAPGGGARIYDFAFDADGAPLYLVGAVGDTAGGLYRASGPDPELVAPFEPGGPEVPRAWTERARPNPRPRVEDARGPRTFRIDGFDGAFHYDGSRLRHEVAGRSDVIADSVEIAWASWPPEGGAGVVSVHRREDPARGAVFRLLPGRDARRILEGPSPQIAWLPARRAYLNDGAGRLHLYDAGRDAIDPVAIDALPAWAGALNPPGEIATLIVERWPLSAGDEASRRALLEKCARDAGPGGDAPFRALVRRGEGDPHGAITGAGPFPTPETAAAARSALEQRGIRARVSSVPVRNLWGAFDSGFVRSPDGTVAFVRRPGENRPFTEVWLRRPDEAPRQLLTTRIGT